MFSVGCIELATFDCTELVTVDCIELMTVDCIGLVTMACEVFIGESRDGVPVVGGVPISNNGKVS